MLAKYIPEHSIVKSHDNQIWRLDKSKGYTLHRNTSQENIGRIIKSTENLTVIRYAAQIANEYIETYLKQQIT